MCPGESRKEPLGPRTWRLREGSGVTLLEDAVASCPLPPFAASSAALLAAFVPH